MTAPSDEREQLVEEMLDAALDVRTEFVRQYGEGQMARTVLFDEMRAALTVAEAAVRAEEREACAKAVCDYCRQGWPRDAHSVTHLLAGECTATCAATEIWAREAGDDDDSRPMLERLTDPVDLEDWRWERLASLPALAAEQLLTRWYDAGELPEEQASAMFSMLKERRMLGGSK